MFALPALSQSKCCLPLGILIVSAVLFHLAALCLFWGLGCRGAKAMMKLIA